MDNRLYGFLLYDDILFKIVNRQLLYYGAEASGQSIFFKAVSLNEVQARLLLFLLMNCTHNIINKDNIMRSVWDEFSLSSSNQRLWQTINELRKKLSSIGLPDGFIESVHGAGYSVCDSEVKPLYIC